MSVAVVGETVGSEVVGETDGDIVGSAVVGEVAWDDGLVVAVGFGVVGGVSGGVYSD